MTRPTRSHRRIACPADALRRAATAIVHAAAVIGVVAGCAAHAPGTEPPPSTASVLGPHVFPAASRLPLPEITARTLHGAPLSLRSLVGHGVLVINVWASWCDNCRHESSVLHRVSSTSPGVRFVGIDEQDRAAPARRAVAAAGITYPQLVDADGSVLQQLTPLPSTGIPSTLVVDAEGRMAASLIGAAHVAELRRLIARVAARS